MTAVTLDELARRLGCRLEGDGTITVSRVASLEDAGPGDLTFLGNPKYAAQVATTRASAVIAGDRAASAPCAMLRTADVYLTLARAIAVLSPAVRPAPGISPLASIDPTAVLGPDVSVGPFVSIGPGVRVGARTVLRSHVSIERGASIGDDCEFHAHVSVRETCVIGHRVVVQNGAVIGSDGFGFAHHPDGSHEKIPQVGPVVIEDDVEIGANTTIDRPAIGETRIYAGAKIDNLVMIAHGVKVGRGSLLAAQVGIAGSSVLDQGVVFAGQVGVAGHVHVGAGVVANAKTGITKDVPPGEHLSGMPADNVASWRESQVIVRRLPELRRTLLRLEQRLAALEARLAAKGDV